MVKKEGLVSIVVPVYNTEKYLDRCISSIVEQTYQKLEILLIDDGSTDKSGKICDEWAARDSRIRVIHKKNEGLGITRNHGIDNANGEYICFFDSDDYFSKDAIEKAYKQAKEDHADVVILGRYLVKAGRDPVPVRFYIDKTVYSGKEVCQIFLPDLIGPDTEKGKFTNLSIGSWVVYSMELIDSTGWQYESENRIISEDIYSQVMLYKDVKTVSVLQTPVYYYVDREGSLSRSYHRYSMRVFNSFYKQMNELVTKCGYDEEVRQRLAYPYFSMVIAYMKMIVKANISKWKKSEELQTIITDNQLQDILAKTNFMREKPARKLLLQVMRKKHWRLCGLMVWIKTKSE